MKKVTHYFVEFYFPGAFFAETSTKEITATVALNPKSIKFPTNCYAFVITSREDIIDGNEIYQGKTIKIGPTYYYPNSKIFTLKGKNSILYGNIQFTKSQKAILTNLGNWHSYDPKTVEIILR